MAQCLVADPAASGALYASAADPCTSMVALTPTEYAQLAASPLNLSPEDGALVAAAVVTVWCIAWGLRALQRVVFGGGDESE